MCVPVGRSVIFGDNKFVVKNGTMPHSKLNKRHNARAYHRVQEAIAAGIISFYHIPGTENSTDILSKHWGYQQIWKILQPILFWHGDTAKLLKGDDFQPANTKQDKGE